LGKKSKTVYRVLQWQSKGGRALYIVSAWAARNRLVFGPVKADEKSKGNEVSTIAAIPSVLEKLALAGVSLR
jgi:hypothetical protein